MPQNRKNSAPPPVMTWAKASWVLAIAAVFDVLRFFFTMFWFFGPALATVYCTSKVGEWVGSLWGLTAAACTAAGGVVGYFSAPVTTVFGSIMAMAVGLFGWMTVGLILLITNSRIFKENAVWFVSSLAISEVPIIGAIPAITIVMWKMYSNQIKIEKAAFKKYEKETADARLQEQNQQTAYLMQARNAQQEQATGEEQFDEEEMNEEAESLAEGGEGSSEESNVQFDTLQDALSELNNKQDRTKEDNIRLNMARSIMERGGGHPLFGNEENDPVLIAAHKRVNMGQKVFNPYEPYGARDGFKFSNVK